jgi:hypothetical protein
MKLRRIVSYAEVPFRVASFLCDCIGEFVDFLGDWFDDIADRFAAK